MKKMKKFIELSSLQIKKQFKKITFRLIKTVQHKIQNLPKRFVQRTIPGKQWEWYEDNCKEQTKTECSASLFAQVGAKEVTHATHHV